MLEFEFDNGEIVYDKLTNEEVKITGMRVWNGDDKKVVYYVDNEYMDGRRIPDDLRKL